MDFTGKRGRIITDDKEIQELSNTRNKVVSTHDMLKFKVFFPLARQTFPRLRAFMLSTSQSDSIRAFILFALLFAYLRIKEMNKL